MRALDTFPDNINPAELAGVTLRKGRVAAFAANTAAFQAPSFLGEARK